MIQQLKVSFFLLFFVGSSSLSLPEEQEERIKEKAFWTWFSSKSEEYFHFESNQTILFDQLGAELGKIHPELTFEFGPIIDNRRDFVISADGMKVAFPYVQSLVAESPEFKKWKIIAFRQRRSIQNIVDFEGLVLAPDDIKFRYMFNRASETVDLHLYVKNYDDSDTRYISAIFLLLDNALGEYDVETKIGALQFDAMLSNPTHITFHPFHKLPEIVDSYFEG